MIAEKPWRRGTAVLAVAWLSLAAPALAQLAEEPRTPRSIAAAMIENADAEGVFEYVHDGFITLRHIQSGLVCRFLLDGQRVVIFPDLAHGEDVGCEQTDGRETVMLQATRYPEPRSLALLMADARAAVVQRFPNARPHANAAPAVRQGDPNTLESAHARYLLIDAAGERRYLRISLAIIDGWVLTLHYSVLASNGEAHVGDAEREADAHWAGAIEDFLIARASP